MTDAWRYKVPTLHGSRWEGAGTMRADLEWPRVSLYCEGHPVPGSEPSHASSLWLAGSLEVDADVLDDLGRVHWSWNPTYPTGDGYLISLHPQARRHAPPVQSLIDDRPTTKGERLAAHPDIRSRVAPFACKLCGQRYAWRSESVQSAAAELWAAGVREFPLHAFAGRVVQSLKGRRGVS